jgi:DNA-binding NarL/FixJ family response regulator
VSARPRVLVVEDDPRLSDVIRAIIGGAGFAAVEVVHTARCAEATVRSFAPDVVLVDLGLPDRDGVDLIRGLRAGALPFRGSILVLTSVVAPERILAALRSGANGYLFKEDLHTRLAASLAELASGGSPLSGRAATVVLRELLAMATPPRNDGALPALTGREAEVLELLSTGASYAEVARELAVQINTIRTHVRSLYEKLGVRNRAEAVNLGWNLGLLRRAG